MNLFFKNVFIVSVLNVLLVSATLNAQEIEPPFDVNRVINRVNYHRDFIGGREDEFLIDTNVVYSPVPKYQWSPSVTFDGTNYLVVWQDSRTTWCDYDIYGARVTQAGIVLDTVGIAISTAISEECDPSVAFDGTNYLVVWQDYSCMTENWDICGARVNQAGVVLDTAGIVISAAIDSQVSPSVAFDGTNYLVVWRDCRNDPDGDIYGARVNQAGVVLDPSGIAISTEVFYQWYPSVAFDGTNYLVVWRRDSGIHGARVNQAGVVLDTTEIIISPTGFRGFPSVAFDGTNYLVVWEYDGIRCARVNQSGEVIDTTDIAISTNGYDYYYPGVIFDGANYLVVWQEKYSLGSNLDIYGARVTPAGVVIDSAGIAISHDVHDDWIPSVSSDGTNSFVVWSHSQFFDIHGARVNQAGVVLDTTHIVVSTVANYQKNPSIAFDGTNYLVVWEDERYGCYNFDIYGARVTQSGVVLDSLDIAIATAPDNQNLPSVGSDGTNYLVVWQDWRNGLDSDIYGARVTQSGVVLDTAGITISTAVDDQICPSTAFDGTNYFIVWEDYRNGPFGDIYGAQVNQAGVILDTTGIAISTYYNSTQPSVAFDGTNYLVVWKVRSGSNSDIYGARVSQSGEVLDSLLPIIISTSTRWEGNPSVAFDGTNYLVVWECCLGSEPYVIYGARVTQSGIVLDPDGFSISNDTCNKCNPSVAFDGTNYLVVWVYYSRYCGWLTRPDIYSAKVSTSGEVLDSCVVSTQKGCQFSPALARGNSDQILITYSGWTDSINAHPANAMRIWGKFYPFVGIEEDVLHSMPDASRLFQVYPNPFSNRINIGYTIHDTGYRIEDFSLRIYDCSGRLVKDFSHTTPYAPRPTHISWDGSDDFGRKLPNGVYFVRLKTEEQSETKKVIFVK